MQELTHHEEALKCFARALQIRPNFEEASHNEGISRLSLGDFELGWRKYEHRWNCAGWRNSQGLRTSRVFKAPRSVWASASCRQVHPVASRAGDRRHDPVQSIRPPLGGQRCDGIARSAAATQGVATRSGGSAQRLRRGGTSARVRLSLPTPELAVGLQHQIRLNAAFGSLLGHVRQGSSERRQVERETGSQEAQAYWIGLVGKPMA